METSCSFVCSGSGTKVNETRKSSRCSFVQWTGMLLLKAVDAGSPPMVWGTWVGLWRRNSSRGFTGQCVLAWEKHEEDRSLGIGLGNTSTCLAVMFPGSHLCWLL